MPVAIAAGLARVRQIRSMTPGSSGSGAGAGGGGTAAVPSVSAPAGAAPTAAPGTVPGAGGQSQVFNITIKGDAVDHDGLVRNIAESTRKLSNRDGVRFGFTTTGEATGA